MDIIKKYKNLKLTPLNKDMAQFFNWKYDNENDYSSRVVDNLYLIFRQR